MNECGCCGAKAGEPCDRDCDTLDRIYPGTAVAEVLRVAPEIAPIPIGPPPAMRQSGRLDMIRRCGEFRPGE